jgi:hypothetical protein
MLKSVRFGAGFNFLSVVEEAFSPLPVSSPP